MKGIAVTFFLLFTVVGFAAEVPTEGTVVGGTIIPGGPGFSTHAAPYGYGGWRSVSNVVERDALSEAYRQTGMAVYVTDEDKLYVLTGDVGSWAWVEFAKGGSLAAVSNQFVLKSGDTMSGVLSMGGFNITDLLPGTSGDMAVTYSQLTNATGTASDLYVDEAGDTMTGLLILSDNPVDDFGAATKQYVDSMGTSTIFSTQLLSNEFFVTSLASNSLFITTLISNDFFTLTLVSNSTFTTSLASNELFISTIISNETFLAGITNQVDDLYVNESGDTMSGNLTISAGGLNVSGNAQFQNQVDVSGDLSVPIGQQIRLGGPGSNTSLTYDGTTITVYKSGSAVMEFDGD